jgi:hypothetical protein
MRRLTKAGHAPDQRGSSPEPNKTVPDPVRGSSVPVWTNNAAKGGAPPPPAIMAIATALPRLLMAAAAPAMTWLPLNVVIVDNDRGAQPELSYIARALRAGAQEVPRDTA